MYCMPRQPLNRRLLIRISNTSKFAHNHEQTRTQTEPANPAACVHALYPVPVQTAPTILLAASPTRGGDVVELLVVIAALIGVVVVGAILIMLLHRAWSTNNTDRPEQAGIGLADQLRQMHRDGELSDEEYARARKLMAARAAGLPAEEATALAEQAAREAAGIRVAEPGKDLTGQPLPTPPAESDSDQGHVSQDPQRPDPHRHDPHRQD